MANIRSDPYPTRLHPPVVDHTGWPNKKHMDWTHTGGMLHADPLADVPPSSGCGGFVAVGGVLRMEQAFASNGRH